MKRFLLLAMSSIFCMNQTAYANTLQINRSTTLYYQESGAGQPIIFIPGWTVTHEFFDKQVPYFSKNYRVITFDPRGQGLSPATLENNNYTQHGKDLTDLIVKLKLTKVIFVAWSWGCFDAYSYIRINGTNNIKSFVCIDAAPKAQNSNNEWSQVTQKEVTEEMQSLEHNRYQFTQSFAQSMVKHKLTTSELNWIVNEVFKTPTYIALLLLFDAINSDYSSEVILLDKMSIPTLNIISESKAAKGRIWLKIHAPHSKIIILGKHMMFWEYPDQFNNDVSNFLKSTGSN